MGQLRNNGPRNRGNRDVRLYGRITIVARVRMRGPFTLLLTQAGGP